MHEAHYTGSSRLTTVMRGRKSQAYKTMTLSALGLERRKWTTACIWTGSLIAPDNPFKHHPHKLRCVVSHFECVRCVTMCQYRETNASAYKEFEKAPEFREALRSVRFKMQVFCFIKHWVKFGHAIMCLCGHANVCFPMLKHSTHHTQETRVLYDV